jgi:hypothetical protein
VGTWHGLEVGRPIAAPLEQCAELLGVDLATVCKLAANVEPYLRADGTRIWSLVQLERQLRPEAYVRRRGGYLDRRQAPATAARPSAALVHPAVEIRSPLDLHLRSGIALPTSSEEGGAMAHPNEELARRGYEAFNNADVETLREVFADTTIFHEPGRSPISGDYEGLDQVLGFFGTLIELSGGAFRAPSTTWWPTTSMPSGSAALTPNATGVVSAALRCWCSISEMAGSPRPGHTTTTSTSSTSSGRRSAGHGR